MSANSTPQEHGLRKLRCYGGNAVLGEREANALIDAYDSLEEQLEAVGVEYVCAYDHKWHTLGLPTRCPMCGTSTFAASSPAKRHP